MLNDLLLNVVKGHCFGGSGYVGVGEPNFFYASITALTLGKIIRLLGFTFQLPPPVAESGFPEGAEVRDRITFVKEKKVSFYRGKV